MSEMNWKWNQPKKKRILYTIPKNKIPNGHLPQKTKSQTDKFRKDLIFDAIELIFSKKMFLEFVLIFKKSSKS